MPILTKKIRYSCLGIGAVILLLAAGTLYCLHNAAKRDRSAIPEETFRTISAIEKNFRDGDIIFREGNGIWSSLIEECSRRDKRYSHVGILFFADGQWQVIHSEADGFLNKEGVFIEPAASFIRNCKAFAVYRLKDRKAAAQLSRHAKKYLNTPFDFSFELEDESKIYCTELIYLAMRDAGSELPAYYHPDLKRRVIPIDSCQDPEIFDEIITFGKKDTKEADCE